MPEKTIIIVTLLFITSFGKNTNDCGRTNKTRSMEEYDFLSGRQRLIGGIETKLNSWPWMGQIVWKSGVHRCGGALISDKFAVTAAHCFSKSRNPSKYYFLLGGHSTGSGTKYSIRNISVHNLYNVILPSSYDIAFMRLASQVNMTDAIHPICLPIFPVGANKLCVVTGWGQLGEHEKRAKALREIHVPVISPFICNSPFYYFGQIDVASMLCAGYGEGGIDACQGDSGGPLMCEVNGRWQLHGLVSWGVGCGRQNRPGVYTNIASVGLWINIQELIYA